MKREGANYRKVVRENMTRYPPVDKWKLRFHNLVTLLDTAEAGIVKRCEGENCVQVNFFNMIGDCGEYAFDDWEECNDCGQYYCGRCKKYHVCTRGQQQVKKLKCVHEEEENEQYSE